MRSYSEGFDMKLNGEGLGRDDGAGHGAYNQRVEKNQDI